MKKKKKKKIKANRCSTTSVLNMTKTVVDLWDLSRLTKTLPDLSRCPYASMSVIHRDSPQLYVYYNHG